MTDKKFTDEEIVKALQQHSQDYDEELKHSPCEDCPVRRSKGGTCIDVMTRGALDIINRQKAEIEGYRKQSEGEWIDKPTGAYGRWQSWCSACGKHSGIGGIESNRHKPFCPNCGAKMKGVNHEQGKAD